MLLQQIVEILDAELTRLEALRTVVAALSGTVDLTVDEPAHTEAQPIAESETQLPVARKKAAGARGVRETKERPPTPARTRKAIAEATALRSAIPATPVVITKAALAKEHAAKRDQRGSVKTAQPAPEPGSLGYMIRALHLDAQA